MKKLVTLILASFVVSTAFSNNAQIVVEQVDNGGVVPGNTYRIYVELLDASHSLHAVFGDAQNSLSIVTTGEFYQSPVGGNTSLDVNSAIINLSPEVAYDTWVTIGSADAAGNNLWNVGVDFDSFAAGSNLNVNDGAWFLVPTDSKCTPSKGNMVLIAQLTTTGVASGNINVQGWTENREAWQERSLNFSTSNAQVFGCMDESATNYNADATYNNGTCEFENGNLDTPPASDDLDLTKGDENGWQVFPNPIWNGQFNIQFDAAVDINERVVVDILDNQGKVVYSEQVAGGNLIGGNKIIVNKNLAAGVYNINIREGESSSTQQVVVQK